MDKSIISDNHPHQVESADNINKSPQSLDVRCRCSFHLHHPDLWLQGEIGKNVNSFPYLSVVVIMIM
jgi:hypothetical protein